MTRADLRDWVEAHGCIPEPSIGQHSRANIITFINPANNRYVYLSTPIDSTIMRRAAVRKVCTILGIQIPEYALSEDDDQQM